MLIDGEDNIQQQQQQKSSRKRLENNKRSIRNRSNERASEKGEYETRFDIEIWVKQTCDPKTHMIKNIKQKQQ